MLFFHAVSGEERCCDKLAQPVIFLSDNSVLREERSELVKIFGGNEDSLMSVGEELLLLLPLFSVMLTSYGICNGKTVATSTIKTQNFQLLFSLHKLEKVCADGGC